MNNSKLYQSSELLRSSQVSQLALKIAANKHDEGVENTQPEVAIEDNCNDCQPAASSLVDVAELDHRIKSLYQPEIGSMQQQITTLMTQVEQLIEQVKAKNI